MRSTGPKGSRRCTGRRAGAGPGPDRHHGWQAERHRLDGRGVCAGLPGPGQVGDRRKPTWPVDALTVNPYLGSDGIDPFVRVAAAEGKGLFILARTSNASAREFQDLLVDGRPLYRHVAERIADWAAPHPGAAGFSFVGAVVGATYPAELAELRAGPAGGPVPGPGLWGPGGDRRRRRAGVYRRRAGGARQQLAGDHLRLQQARGPRPVRRRLARRRRRRRPGDGGRPRRRTPRGPAPAGVQASRSRRPGSPRSQNRWGKARA